MSNLEYLRNEVLMAGADDWVDVPEVPVMVSERLHYPTDWVAVTGLERSQVTAAVHDVAWAASQRAALPTALEVTKSLLFDGLIEVGETLPEFVAWPGSLKEIADRINSSIATAEFPVVASVPFWIQNTAAGDEIGNRLLNEAAQ